MKLLDSSKISPEPPLIQNQTDLSLMPFFFNVLISSSMVGRCSSRQSYANWVMPRSFSISARSSGVLFILSNGTMHQATRFCFENKGASFFSCAVAVENCMQSAVQMIRVMGFILKEKFSHKDAKTRKKLQN